MGVLKHALITLDVGSTHGAYIGYEWELGAFHVASGSDPRDLSVSVFPITEAVTQGANEIFTIPSVYYGTYKGDIDALSSGLERLSLLEVTDLERLA